MTIKFKLHIVLEKSEALTELTDAINGFTGKELKTLERKLKKSSDKLKMSFAENVIKQ